MYGIHVINIHELEKIPLCKFWNEFDQIKIAMKLITGNKHDNGQLKLENNGNLFAFALFKKTKINEYEVSVWDLKGWISLYDKEFQSESCLIPIPIDIIKEIKNVTQKYIDGKIKCSDCAKEINKKEIGGHYFAGTYCEDCWLGNIGKYEGKGGWKYIESQESYN